MKKLKSLLAVVLILVFTVFAGACSEKLETPTGLDIDESNNLIWNIVDGARSYTVEITFVGSGQTTEETVRPNSFSIAKLAVGDYKFRVKAVGGRQNGLVSNWSEPYDFYKDYDSGITYNLINGGKEYEIGRSGNAEGEIVIKDTYRDKPITRISQGAFRGCGKLKRVVVGSNVKEIGTDAFTNCRQLESVVLPEGLLSLGESVFQQCNVLAEVNIPTTVTQIPAYAFAYCSVLSKIQLHEGLTSIGNYAFCNCYLIQDVKIPDTVTNIGEYAFYMNKALTLATIGSGIEKIARSAFSGCSGMKEVKLPAEAPLTIESSAFSGCAALESIALPVGTTSLGNYTFQACSALSEISIPASVTSIGAYSFKDTKLYESQVADGYIYADKWLVNVSLELGNSIKELPADALKQDTFGIADSVFITCPLLEEVALPRSVKYIGAYSFAQCPVLYRFTTSDNSLIEVGFAALSDCPLLANVQFGRGLETIESYAFFRCLALDNNQFDVERLVPESVTRIGTYAFKGTALWGKPDKFGVVYAGNWVVGFDPDKMSASEVELKEEAVGIADYAFFLCESLSGVIGLNRVQYLGRGAFFGCPYLRSVSLNRSLRVIKEYTFYGCGSLAIVNFPARLTEVERYAFAYCVNLSDIDLSETQVKKIAYRAFSSSTDLSINAHYTSVAFPDTLETIESYAFYGSLVSGKLEIPGSVKYIGHRAFAQNPFKELVIGEGVEAIGSYAFKGCKMSSVILPESMKTIGDYAFYGCDRLTSIDFGGTQTIGSYAFARNISLSSLTIPQSIVSIGEYAFRDCSNLTSVVIQNTLKYVGVNAFYGCFQLTAYACGGREMENDWAKWNSSFRPVVWDSTLSGDGTYIESIKIGAISNAFDGINLMPPARAGYEFVGWTTTPNGEAVYSALDIMYLQAGETVYTVWKEIPVEPDPPVENPPAEEPPGEESTTPPGEDLPVDNPNPVGPTPELQDLIREYLKQIKKNDL